MQDLVAIPEYFSTATVHLKDFIIISKANLNK